MSLSRQWRAGRRFLAVAALSTVVATIAGALPAQAAPGQAGATENATITLGAAGTLAVTVADVSPSVLTPGAALTVRGTVRNAGTATVDAVTVTLRSRGPLASRASVARWQAAAPEDYRGSLVRSQQITTPLAPGADTSFSLTATATVLGVDASARGPQPIGLAVSAGPGSGSTAGGAAVTVVRTFAVWAPRTTEQGVRLGVLVPVTQPVPAADAGAAG
ncbi:MAG TPA: DUF6049 family protein, partial [Kineosporiaceae bacterium]|nr:DUF6049 family protein [Kineosporiaceae bacterium]